MPDQVNVIMDQPGLSKHGGLSRRHRKKTNPTFTDGHAESLRTERRKLPTRKVSRLWNRINESIRKRFKGNFYHGFDPDFYFAKAGWSS